MEPTRRTKVLTFRPDHDLDAAMLVLREREGVPYSEQIRRALRAWLTARGALKQTSRRRMR
jgi:hypothetical protein